MGRWEPDAQGRLERAAMDLFVDPGYDRVTVADIATRAGLTKRTFFRHYADKREVLFRGAEQLQDFLVARVQQAPAGTEPVQAIVDAVAATGSALFDERRDFGVVRAQMIRAYPELQERELSKLAALTTAFADALRARGTGDPFAVLAAEAGVAVFKIAFGRWTAPGETRPVAVIVHETYAQLVAVAAPATAAPSPAGHLGAQPSPTGA